MMVLSVLNSISCIVERTLAGRAKIITTLSSSGSREPAPGSPSDSNCYLKYYSNDRWIGPGGIWRFLGISDSNGPTSRHGRPALKALQWSLPLGLSRLSLTSLVMVAKVTDSWPPGCLAATSAPVESSRSNLNTAVTA